MTSFGGPENKDKSTGSRRHGDFDAELLRRRYERLRKAYRRKALQCQQFQGNSQELFENMEVGVLLIDMKGKISFFNQKAEKILGFQKDEVLNTHFRTLLTLDDLSDGFKAFYEATLGHYVPGLRIRLRKKDRSTMVALLHNSPFYEGSRLAGVIAFFIDISEQKKFEELNRKRVNNFIQFTREIDEWREKVIQLKQQVNDLRTALSKKKES